MYITLPLLPSFYRSMWMSRMRWHSRNSSAKLCTLHLLSCTTIRYMYMYNHSTSENFMSAVCICSIGFVRFLVEFTRRRLISYITWYYGVSSYSCRRRYDIRRGVMVCYTTITLSGSVRSRTS